MEAVLVCSDPALILPVSEFVVELMLVSEEVLSSDDKVDVSDNKIEFTTVSDTETDDLVEELALVCSESIFGLSVIDCSAEVGVLEATKLEVVVTSLVCSLSILDDGIPVTIQPSPLSRRQNVTVEESVPILDVVSVDSSKVCVSSLADSLAIDGEATDELSDSDA